MSNRTLYALLVGVNEYLSKDITNLNGCVNDVKAMQAFLEKQEDLDAHLLCLTDAEATKAKLISAFQEHLGKAQKGDSVLFYFAGHGIQEETTIPLFAHAEAGGLIESMMCHDSFPYPGEQHKTCLADKELRFLIHQLAEKGPQISIVIDCCHSGTVNRDVPSESLVARQGREQAFPARAWEGYFFHDVFQESQFQAGSLKEILPQGKHVFLGACSDTEYAWEHTQSDGEKRGFFTYHLLNQLEKDPFLSYQQLISRLISILGDRKRKIQHPQIGGFPPQNDQANQVFLREEKRQDKGTALLSFTQAHQWRIDKGAIHGLTRASAAEGARLLNHEGLVLRILQIGPGFSLVDVPPGVRLHPGEHYPVEISLEQLANVPFYLDLPSEEKSAVISQVESEQEKYAGEPIWWEQLEERAKYCIRRTDQAYFITLAEDQRPLTAGISNPGAESGYTLLTDYLNHIRKWEHIVQLNSPIPPPGGNFPVKIELLDAPSNHLPLAELKGDPVEIGLEKDHDGEGFRRTYLKLTNTLNRPPLHFSPLSSPDFWM